jgi:hypothetical protein
VPGIDVFDADGEKVGTVTHVFEFGPAPVPPSTPGAAPTATMPAAGTAAGTVGGSSTPATRPALNGTFEVKTGLFGLGKHYFVPFDAIKDITTGGIFVSTRKADFESMGWDRKPDSMTSPTHTDQVVAPRQENTVSPVGEATDVQESGRRV